MRRFLGVLVVALLAGGWLLAAGVRLPASRPKDFFLRYERTKKDMQLPTEMIALGSDGAVSIQVDVEKNQFSGFLFMPSTAQLDTLYGVFKTQRLDDMHAAGTPEPYKIGDTMIAYWDEQKDTNALSMVRMFDRSVVVSDCGTSMVPEFASGWQTCLDRMRGLLRVGELGATSTIRVECGDTIKDDTPSVSVLGITLSRGHHGPGVLCTLKAAAGAYPFVAFGGFNKVPLSTMAKPGQTVHLEQADGQLILTVR